MWVKSLCYLDSTPCVLSLDMAIVILFFIQVYKFLNCLMFMDNYEFFEMFIDVDAKLFGFADLSKDNLMQI
jgi:hypothetical protein